MVIRYILNDTTYDLMMNIHPCGLIIYISLVKLQKWIIYEIVSEVFYDWSYKFGNNMRN
jgi:hypothetical protein